MADDKFDVIIVGAGPSGTSAAITAAKAGLNTVLLERGEYPGAKNVQGAILYTKMLAEIVPDFWKDPNCPMDRHITQQTFVLTDDKAYIRGSYHSDEWQKEPHNCYSIIRAQFDQWYAKKAEEAGAEVYSGITVSKLVQKEGKVIGIETSDGDQLLADVVIACDGVNSMLAQSIGLIDEWTRHEVALGVKEVLALPKEKIEDRFQLEGNEGCTYEILGKITKGLMGYVFLYTNKDTLAFGTGCKLDHFEKFKVSPADLLEEAKKHTAVRKLIKDAKPIEYSAHLIPEGGYRSMPPLAADGFLVAGDAAQMINPTRREGSNLAMTAGRLAAETAAEAHKKGDFSKTSLSAYEQKLKKSFIMQDLIDHQDVAEVIEKNLHVLTTYPEMMSEAMFKYFSVDGRPKKEIMKDIFKTFKKKRGYLNIAKDLWSIRKAV